MLHSFTRFHSIKSFPSFIPSIVSHLLLRHNACLLLSSVFTVNTFRPSPPSFSWQYVSDEVCIAGSSLSTSLQPHCLSSAVEYFLQHSLIQACPLPFLPCASFFYLNIACLFLYFTNELDRGLVIPCYS